jgi:hypothetical protein
MLTAAWNNFGGRAYDSRDFAGVTAFSFLYPFHF